MKVAVGSIVRNGGAYVNRHADQFEALCAATDDHAFYPIIVEGDSTDKTVDLLHARFNGAVTHATHGGPVFGSVGDPVRFRQSSWTWEHVLARVGQEYDAFVYIEADLVWRPTAILQLIEHLDRPGVDVVVPFCWFGKSRFYDTWGLRGMDGQPFGPYSPHHYDLLTESPTGLYPISSAGSCLVMKGEVARAAHFVPEDLAIVGFCQNAREKGFNLWLDPSIRVEHPE